MLRLLHLFLCIQHPPPPSHSAWDPHPAQPSCSVLSLLIFLGSPPSPVDFDLWLFHYVTSSTASWVYVGYWLENDDCGLFNHSNATLSKENHEHFQYTMCVAWMRCKPCISQTQLTENYCYHNVLHSRSDSHFSTALPHRWWGTSCIVQAQTCLFGTVNK
jgi:hypothetical protein